MRIAVSNIAWEPDDDDAVAAVMRAAGATGVELAPTKRWPLPLDASVTDARAYRDLWLRRGLEPVAMQALLFGRPDLTIFGDAAARAATVAYLDGICALAGTLGTRALVFGSPKNRLVGALPPAETHTIAVDFFGAVAERAITHGVVLCIEANPVEYGCDFVTTSGEAVALARAVNSPGFGVHLDAAGMVMSHEPIEEAVRVAMPWVRHFHASEPHLAPIGDGAVPHERFAAALMENGYVGWVSIEMRGRPDAVAMVAEATARVARVYASA